MSRLTITLLLLLLTISGCAFAQRHGRADSVQNYSATQRIASPILSINIKSTKTWQYFHRSDLLEMDRETVEVIDPTTSAKNVYEGVSLGHLVAGSSSYRLEVYRDFWAFRDKRVPLDSSLSEGSHVIVADTVDGKSLGRDNPYCLIVCNVHGDQVVVKNLAYIRLDDTPHK
jgi:hypothetical protein